MFTASEIFHNRTAAIDALHAKAAKCQDRGQWRAAARHLQQAGKILERL